MALGGAILRVSQTIIRGIQFCCAAIILGIFSYFLAVLSKHHMHIPTWERAVEGMSGAAALYTIFAILTTICLGGVAFFAAIAIFLDICFVGCFAAIAYYNRKGVHSCKGFVTTPLGNAQSSADAPGAGDFRYVCNLEKVVFAISIIALALFIISALVQVLLVHSHRKEKKYGPGPSNNYTSGTGRKAPFWKRNRKVRNTRDAELATGGTVRPSGDSHLTGTTHNTGYVQNTSEAKYGQPGYGANGHHGFHNPTATNY